MMYYDAIPENQGSSSSGRRWLHSNELKMDNRLKIASTIRSVFASLVTYTYNYDSKSKNHKVSLLLTEHLHVRVFYHRKSIKSVSRERFKGLIINYIIGTHINMTGS